MHIFPINQSVCQLSCPQLAPFAYFKKLSISFRQILKRLVAFSLSLFSFSPLSALLLLPCWWSQLLEILTKIKNQFTVRARAWQPAGPSAMSRCFIRLPFMMLFIIFAIIISIRLGIICVWEGPTTCRILNK